MSSTSDPHDMDAFDADTAKPHDTALPEDAWSSMEEAGESAALENHSHPHPAEPSSQQLDSHAWSDQPPLEPNADAVDVFWQEASKVAGLTRLDVVVGPTPLGVIPPPAWQFGGPESTAHSVTTLAHLVASGTKRATSSVAAEYADQGEDLPEVGQLSIVCDGAGRPTALISTDRVDQVPFDQVDAEFAAEEGEGDMSLDLWRREHVRLLPQFQSRPVEEPWDESTPWPTDVMVLEHFTCLYPTQQAAGRRLFG